MGNSKKDPIHNFNEAVQEFQTAAKLWSEQQQDAVFAKENPDRNHWVRKVGEIEAYAELFFKGHKAAPGAQLYYIIKRSPKGGLKRFVINGKPDDPCDLTEEQARQVWSKAAADNF